MKVVKVHDAIGPALDWLVAKALGGKIQTEHGVFLNRGDGYEYFTPSTEWAQGGPIIERERIDLQAKINAGSDYDEWLATIGIGAKQRRRYGPTPLVAAMRCFVASKLGDEVEVPEELCQ